MGLTNNSHVMISGRLAQRISLHTGRLLELLNSSRILLLSHKGIAQIICCLRILGILLYSLAIRYLSLIVLSQSELLITRADILAVGSLSMSGERKEERGGRTELITVPFYLSCISPSSFLLRPSSRLPPLGESRGLFASRSPLPPLPCNGRSLANR